MTDSREIRHPLESHAGKEKKNHLKGELVTTEWFITYQTPLGYRTETQTMMGQWCVESQVVPGLLRCVPDLHFNLTSGP